MARTTLTHVPSAPGIAIGRAYVITPDVMSIPHYWIAKNEIAAQQERFRLGVETSWQQLRAVRERLCRFQGPEQQQILDAHLLLLKDEMVVDRTLTLLRDREICAEWAFEKTLAQLVAAMEGASDTFFQERKADIEQIGARIMRNLLGMPTTTLERAPYPDTIVFAPDLSPAEIIALTRLAIKGIVVTRGGYASHTAIIARALELPAILGIEQPFDEIATGDHVILDANEGKILIQPTQREINLYAKARANQVREHHALMKERSFPAITLDGYAVALAANIELLEEIPSAIEHGAEQVGLMRTEYLFLHRPGVPSEEEQFIQYKEMLEAMAPRPVTIRTLDIGGERVTDYLEYQEHTNPALGLRAIRFCLREQDIFRTQLRALYRASIYGPLRILFPLISGLEEWHAIEQHIAVIQHELTREALPFDPDVPLGSMIEVPSAVMVADQLAKECDFFNIGTNDLTQYTLAVDRGNEHVAYLYNSLHPAVLRMIHHTVMAAKRHRISVTLCGEMAGDPRSLLPLIGLEIDTLSMNSVSIPRVKRLIRESSFQHAKALAAKALQASTLSDVERLVDAAVALDT